MDIEVDVEVIDFDPTTDYEALIREEELKEKERQKKAEKEKLAAAEKAKQPPKVPSQTESSSHPSKTYGKLCSSIDQPKISQTGTSTSGHPSSDLPNGQSSTNSKCKNELQKQPQQKQQIVKTNSELASSPKTTNISQDDVQPDTLKKMFDLGFKKVAHVIQSTPAGTKPFMTQCNGRRMSCESQIEGQQAESESGSSTDEITPLSESFKGNDIVRNLIKSCEEYASKVIAHSQQEGALKCNPLCPLHANETGQAGQSSSKRPSTTPARPFASLAPRMHGCKKPTDKPIPNLPPLKSSHPKNSYSKRPPASCSVNSTPRAVSQPEVVQETPKSTTPKSTTVQPGETSSGSLLPSSPSSTRQPSGRPVIICPTYSFGGEEGSSANPKTSPIPKHQPQKIATTLSSYSVSRLESKQAASSSRSSEYSVPQHIAAIESRLMVPTSPPIKQPFAPLLSHSITDPLPVRPGIPCASEARNNDAYFTHGKVIAPNSSSGSGLQTHQKSPIYIVRPMTAPKFAFSPQSFSPSSKSVSGTSSEPSVMKTLKTTLSTVSPPKSVKNPAQQATAGFRVKEELEEGCVTVPISLPQQPQKPQKHQEPKQTQIVVKEEIPEKIVEMEVPAVEISPPSPPASFPRPSSTSLSPTTPAAEKRKLLLETPTSGIFGRAKKLQKTGGIHFACNWKGCDHKSRQLINVISHIRKMHFKVPATNKEQVRKGVYDPEPVINYVKEI